MLSSQQEMEFSAFENKVDEVMKILNMMSSEEKNSSETAVALADQ